ncbi:hypothetical protein ERUR111494_01815 [Erysipelothrix urinaevulpis]|uniref:hypothetical protein n=1 Tax=Erysipelothrix urinaevulpis TaxID=2683717 RepID=UPI00135B5B87|nr:hypothetical protein [Erysipelothrix urinaevulpis]
MKNYNYQEQWIKPAIKIGRISILFIMITSFLPVGYLYLKYGVIPSFNELVNAWVGVATTFGPFYLIELFSYFPIFGTAGSYLAISTGNMVNLKLPASATAQEVLGVENGTPKGEVVSMLGIAGSIITNLAFLTICVILGSQIMRIMPPSIERAFNEFTIPALFGALYGQLSLNNPKIGIIALPMSLIMYKFFNLPQWFMLVVVVFGTPMIIRGLYKKNIVK